MTRPPESQGTLFDLPPPTLQAVAPSAEQVEIAARLPASIRVGAMTWSYPGWLGSVYAQPASAKQLANYGLSAYAQLPLLRAAEIDRSYYEPLPAEAYRHYAKQVPSDFRFLVKAHEDCTVARYPLHARYGKKRGLDNPLFLDPAYAERVVLAAREGLGDKLAAVLFQFPPQDVSAPRIFAARVRDFLQRLPGDVHYALELRNDELLTPAYGAALADTGALHCHNAWTAMPSVTAQARRLPPATRRPLVVRWLLRPNESFADARTRYEPFQRIVSEDLERREEIARLVARAHTHGVPALVLVDNKAEGSAPASVQMLASAIVRALDADRAVQSPPVL